VRLLILGDFIADKYIFGTSVRLCPEAPVAVIVPQIERTSAGGAGLVTRQLEELGADVQSWYGSFSEKTRVFAGNHLICRIDKDATERVPKDPSDEFLSGFDAYVVSDYGKGALTEKLAKTIRSTGKPCFVDAKHHWAWYESDTAHWFPNTSELFSFTPELLSCSERIVQKLGADGCAIGSLHLPATVCEVVDTTGAGDIFLAGFVWAWSLSLPKEHCLQVANELAGQSCRRVGTCVVGKEFAQSVLDRLRSSRESQPQVPVSSPDSTLSMPPLTLGIDRWSASVAERVGNQLADCEKGQSGQEAAPGTPLVAQTLPQSPSDPTAPSGTPIPLDRESSVEQDRRLR
jgi:bifunctional ADP-heptose synthase (sugar kinase/adenylyltransferase)